MDIFKEFITSRRKLVLMSRQIDALRRENKRLRAEKAEMAKAMQKKPTVADRTLAERKKDAVDTKTIIDEWMNGERAANG